MKLVEINATKFLGLSSYKLPNSFNKNNTSSILDLLTANIFQVESQYVINQDFPIKEEKVSKECKSLYIGPTFEAMNKIIETRTFF